MKKLVLAAAISGLMSASVNAATVYENNGLKYDLKGDWQIQLRKDVGDNQKLDVEFDDLELKNRVTYDLSEGLKAFGQLDYGFKRDAEGQENGSRLEEAYLGLDFNGTKVAIGKMDYATDEFGVDSQYEDTLDEDRFDAVNTSGDDVIRVDASFGATTLIVSTELEAEGESSADGESFDVFVSTELDALALGAAYQSFEANGSADSIDSWGVSASYDAGFATFGADYSSSDENNNDVDQYNLVAAIKAGKTTKVVLGMTNIDQDGSEDVTEWYANVTYKFATQKNVSLFAEIADTDRTGDDVGALAGIRLKF